MYQCTIMYVHNSFEYGLKLSLYNIFSDVLLYNIEIFTDLFIYLQSTMDINLHGVLLIFFINSFSDYKTFFPLNSKIVHAGYKISFFILF